MIDAERYRRVKRCLPIGEALPRCPVNQVNAGTHAVIVCGTHSGLHIRRGVTAVQGAQHMPDRGLHTEGNAVESALCKLGYVVGVDGVRIRLSGDFSIVGKPPNALYSVKHGHQIACRQHGGGPASKEDRTRGRFIDAMGLLPLGDALHLFDRHPCVPVP